MPIDWKQYDAAGLWDELVTPSGRARPGAGPLLRVLSRLTDEELSELAIRTMGITFTVYDTNEPGGIDREWPFDIVPRLIRKREWDAIAQGLTQRVRGLNAFIDDIYHHQRILRDGVLPAAWRTTS